MRQPRFCFACCLLALSALPGRAADGAATMPSATGPTIGTSAKGPHHVYLVGSLLVTEPWIQIDPQSPDQALAYFTIENRGGSPDRLLSATSTAADKIVVDANGSDPGLGDGGLTIPPGKAVTLKPDGVHFLFQTLHGDIRAAPFVPGILTFERAGPLPVAFATDSSRATPVDPTEVPAPEVSLTK